MFVKKSLRERLVCFAVFVGMILLALVFLPSLVNWFLRACLPSLFAAVFKCFLHITTSTISGTATSNKSALTRFAAGRPIHAKRDLQSSQYLVQVHRTLSNNASIEWILHLSWSNHLVTSFGLERNIGGYSKHLKAVNFVYECFECKDFLTFGTGRFLAFTKLRTDR